MTAIMQEPEHDFNDDDEYRVVKVIEEPPADDSVSNLFGELGVDDQSDAMIKVYRINETGKEAHCFDTVPSGLEGIEDRLREAYGRGDYKLKAFLPTPQGKKSLKKVVKMTLETPKEKPVAAQDNSKDDMRDLILEIQRSHAESQRNMISMFKESQMESQLKLQEMMIQLIGNKPETPSLPEQLTMLKALQPEQKDPIEYLSVMMEFQSKLRESFEPPPSTPLGELSSGINSLVKLAANSPKPGAVGLMNNAPAANQASAAAPGPALQAAPTQPSAQPLPQPQPQPLEPQAMKLSDPLVKAQLHAQLNTLLQKAKQDKNPALYAEMTVEETPPKYYPLLREAVGEDSQQALHTFSQIEPGILQYPEWFIEYADCIRELFVQADEVMADLPDDDDIGDNEGDSDSNQSDVNTAQHDTTPHNNESGYTQRDSGR